MNELIWIALLIVHFSLILLAYKLFGKVGLYAVIAASIVLANIKVLKLVEMGGALFTLGNIAYGGIFLATDILNERHGKKAAQKSVWVGFFVALLAVIMMQFALWFTPAFDDFAHAHLEALFSLVPRIVLASMIAYLISQTVDVWMFDKLKRVFHEKKLWLRNNISTMLGQLIDSAIFVTIAFLGVFPLQVFWQILITTYLIKLLVAVLDTPFMYLAKRVKTRDD